MDTLRRRTAPLIAAALVTAGLLLAGGPGSVLAADADYIAKMRLANRYLAQGVPDAAIKVLEQLLQKHPADLKVSMTYAEALIQVDLLDEADQFLASAMEKVEEKADLARVRVKLRRAQNRPQEAFEDVLFIMNAKVDLATWAYRETHELLAEGLDAKAADRVVQDLRREHEATLEYTILAGVVTAHREGSEKALGLVLDFDRDNAREGRAVFSFAQEMLALGREPLALEGLLASVELTPRPERRSPILFQVAEIQERQGKYTDALASLTRIAEEREGSTASGTALLRSAEIHQKHLDDPQGALAVYHRIQDDPILGHHRPMMLLQMGDCYVRLGEFEKASRKYAQVIPEAFDPQEAELAALKLADIEFFNGNPDSALILYQDMAEANPRSLFTDTAADRYILLNKFQAQGGDVLGVFGKMEWARMVGDSVQVEEAAQIVMEQSPPGEIAVEALLALAEVAAGGGNYPRALRHLETLVQRYPSERKAPEALMRAGSILNEKLGRPQEALMKYESVLTEYPSSVQAGDARRLVETLRRELKS